VCLLDTKTRLCVKMFRPHEYQFKLKTFINVILKIVVISLLSPPPPVLRVI
jgi:hypothetical protein